MKFSHWETIAFTGEADVVREHNREQKQAFGDSYCDFPEEDLEPPRDSASISSCTVLKLPATMALCLALALLAG